MRHDWQESEVAGMAALRQNKFILFTQYTLRPLKKIKQYNLTFIKKAIFSQKNFVSTAFFFFFHREVWFRTSTNNSNFSFVNKKEL